MKNLISYVFAGIIGGIITLGGHTLLFPQNDQRIPKANYAQSVNHLNASPTANAVPFDFKDAARLAMPAVVHIHAKQSEEKARQNQQQNDPFSFFFGQSFPNSPFQSPFEQFYAPQKGSGSGVIYTQDGYIVTNNHVVEFADEYEVTLYDNRKFIATLVGTYPSADLAVLKIEANNLPTLRLANSDNAQIGEWVLAVGNPFDLTSTVTAGIISAKGRDIDIIKDDNNSRALESFIQTDAAVNPGNSGGALVNATGELLGINTAISTHTGVFEGYSFAIPANIMRKVVDDIITYGNYQRGYLGIEVADLDSDFSKELGLNITQGVVVTNVVHGGAALIAGVLPNDVIVAINGKNVNTAPELQEIVSQSKVGDTLALTIIRNSRNIEVEVRLREN